MPSVDVARALEFVAAHGTSAHNTLAAVAVGKASPETALMQIGTYQRPDGGWARIDPDFTADLSLISQTWLGLHWLIALRPAGADALARTLEFLAASQQTSGCWDEPDAILAYDPPPWMVPNQQANQVWLTSAVCCKLKELGCEDSVRFNAALGFLRAAWQGSRFPGSPHPHWMALPLFTLNGPRAEIDTAITMGCHDVLYPLVDRAALDPLDVIAVAYGAHLCGNFAAELFLLALDRVLSFQQPDGGWTTHYGDQHRPGATVDALFLLRRVGMI